MKKILLLVVSLCMVMMASGCSDSGSTGSSDSTPVITNPVEEQVLWDSDNVKVSFIKVYEEPSISGAAYLQLKVENNTDKTVTVRPKDAYVNDTSTILGSGVPMTLLPNKKSQTPFIIFYTNLGITSKDEIEKIEFKLEFEDENYDTVVETDNLVITLP